MFLQRHTDCIIRFESLDFIMQIWIYIGGILYI